MENHPPQKERLQREAWSGKAALTGELRRYRSEGKSGRGEAGELGRAGPPEAWWATFRILVILGRAVVKQGMGISDGIVL